MRHSMKCNEYVLNFNIPRRWEQICKKCSIWDNVSDEKSLMMCRCKHSVVWCFHRCVLFCVADIWTHFVYLGHQTSSQRLRAGNQRLGDSVLCRISVRVHRKWWVLCNYLDITKLYLILTFKRQLWGCGYLWRIIITEPQGWGEYFTTIAVFEVNAMI